jgi:hypothetical protein
MKHAFLATLLALGLSGTARAAEPSSRSFPDTAAGRRVAAFFEAFGSGSEDRLAEYFSAAVSPEGLRQRSAAARAKRLAGIHQETGAVEVRRVDAPAAGKLVVVTDGAAKRLTRWDFTFGPPPETFLVGIGIDDADVPVPNVAEGYTRSWDGEERTEGPRRSNVYTRPARGSAAGGGYSTAPDLLRFTAALLSDRLLSPPFTEWFVTGAGPFPGPVPGDRKRGAFGFAGGAPGISALLELNRQTGFVVVVLANDDPPAATALGREIGRLLGAIRP